MINIDKIYKSHVDSKFISIDQYKQIIHLFIKFLVKKLFSGEEIQLPFKLGKFFVIGKEVKPSINPDGKIKGLAPNWKETNKLWKEDEEARKNKIIVYLFNEHSNNIRYKFFYSKRRSTVKYKFLYTFFLTRKNKRTLASIINNGKEFLIK